MVAEVLVMNVAVRDEINGGTGAVATAVVKVKLPEVVVVPAELPDSAA
jgi:hypothetical protein